METNTTPTNDNPTNATFTNDTFTNDNPVGPAKRLERVDGKLGGVAAGLGDYFDVDPTMIRLGLVALTVLGGFPAIPIAYVAAWAIMPERPAFVPPAPSPADRVDVSPTPPVAPEAPTGTPA